MAQHHAQVCYGTVCVRLDAASPPMGGWLSALPHVALKGDIRRNCVQCDMESLSRKPSHPSEVWDAAGSVHRPQDVSQEALWFVANKTHKLGWVPALLPAQSLNTAVGWRKYPPKHRLLVDLPCSSARGEDAAVLRSFFTDRDSGAPLRDGTFLEIGGANGLEQSNSWIFEVCLGWKGVLVEAHPRFFSQLIRHRPASLNMNFAVCSPGAGWANFSAQRWTGARMIADTETSVKTVSVQCGQVGLALSKLGVARLDFLSVDVEGAELNVLRSLDFARLTVGVVLVEVRGDGVRPGLLRYLLHHGMRYVGQFTGRGTSINAIIDDVYVNFTHLEQYFPRSSALAAWRLARRHHTPKVARRSGIKG